MFDFRYHALSLVAVFVALALGLLLGVAIGDRGLVSSAESDLRGSLRENVVEAREDAARARRALRERRRVEQQSLYPILVDDRLAGARIGLVGLGRVPDRMVDLTRRALADTGGRLVSVSVIDEPLDLEAIGRALKGQEIAELASDPEDLDAIENLGEAVGEDFATGGKLLRRLRGSLLRRGSSSGSLNGLEGVVLVRSPPGEPGESDPPTSAFARGLVRGLDRPEVNVVGAETESAKPSSIPWFEQRRISSVDSIDRLEGRAALVFALAGERGAFGVKSTADALLPSVVGRTQR